MSALRVSSAAGAGGLWLFLICCVLVTPTYAATPEGWSHRAILEVEAGDLDTAALRVTHAGVAQDDADDYRVFDPAGRPVAYEVTYHHPGRDSLLSFRAGTAGRYAVHFGNPDAPRDPLRVMSRGKVGGGAPTPGADGWTPSAGLVLTTMRRPRDTENPRSVEQMQALLDASPALDGGEYVANVSHGVNPFGDSDHFISVYRGWMRLPRDGTFGFCTASNEASFSFLGGAELVHWPGRHTEKRGQYAEKSREHSLRSGLRYLEYYHEEVLLYQVAFLGVKAPGADRYWSIPDDWFPQPRKARVIRYETHDGQATVMPRLELLDSLWPRERDRGQYTRHRLHAVGGEDWDVRWSVASRTLARGHDTAALFLTLGDFTVRMTARSSRGQVVERRWPLTVFPVEHLEGAFNPGKAADYQPLVEALPRDTLSTDELVELAWFESEFGSPPEAKSLAEMALGRPDASAEHRASMSLLAAGNAGTSDSFLLGESVDPSAAQHLRQALGLEDSVPRKLAVLARLIRVAPVSEADELYQLAESLAREAGLPALRDATIARGDARLAAGDRHGASEDYRTAEALAEVVVPQPVRLARIGSLPETLAQHLAAQRTDEALQVLRQWREDFPADALNGTVFFWAGVAQQQRRRWAASIACLRRAVALAPGSEFEAEARYRVAQAHRESGDPQTYRQELSELLASGLTGEHRDRAQRELESAP